MMNAKDFNSSEFKNQKIYYTYSKELNAIIYALNAEKISDHIESYRDEMPENRYSKLMKYKFDMDKKLLIGNEILFQYGLKQIYPNRDHKEFVRAVDQAGKPYLEGEDDMYFNMSHAGKYSVCAFSDKPIGVDIERIKPIDLSIAEKYYCKDEYVDIMQRSKHNQLKRFYEYWVLKESFVKAVGLGLSIPLDEFAFSNFKGHELLRVNHSVDNHNYISQKFNFSDSSYELAICVQTA